MVFHKRGSSVSISINNQDEMSVQLFTFTQVRKPVKPGATCCGHVRATSLKSKDSRSASQQLYPESHPVPRRSVSFRHQTSTTKAEQEENQAAPPKTATSTASSSSSSRNTSGKIRSKRFTLKRERSTAVLVGIVIVFIICHACRFSIQLYEVSVAFSLRISNSFLVSFTR